MKKLINSYRQGNEGNPVHDNPTRLQKAAHNLGRRSFIRLEEEDKFIDDQKIAQFEQATAKSKGINKQVMAIIAEASKIPHQRATSSIRGVEKYGPDKSVVEWTTSLMVGEDRDPSRPGKTPLIAKFGALRIDSTDWAHNGYNIKVHNIALHASAAIRQRTPSERWETGIMPVESGVRSTIWINTSSYNPNDMDPDDEREFTGGVRIDVDEAGIITAIGMSHSDTTGYDKEDPTRVSVNLNEFLSGIESAAQETARAYQEISDIDNL